MNAPLPTDELGLGFIGYTRQEGEAILRGETIAEPLAVEFSCIHRGAFVEMGLCDQCSRKGQPFEILVCAVHGKCSIGRKNRRVKSCVRCEERIPIASD